MSKYLKKPVTPFQIPPNCSIGEVINGMEGTAFQARNLAQGAKIWGKMCQGKTMIFLGLAGAMVPAGMRKVVAHLIEQRWIDCLVSTGANLFHDCHETLGKLHWQGDHNANDKHLFKEGIDRIYDVFAVEQEFQQTDKFINEFAKTLDQSRPYTTREFLYLLGRKLAEVGVEDGILTAAARQQIPVYCPAIADSSIGIGLAYGRAKGENNLQLDVIADVVETAQLASATKDSGVIYIGGGTPKNFIQQTEVTASILGYNCHGHKYAVQVTTDAPHWGGLSGCTFEEAQSWGKIAEEALKVTIFCDATIALPIIASAIAQNSAETIRQRKYPRFELGRELKVEY